MTEQNSEKVEPRKTKDQLKVLALKERIGQITSMYEETIADMRAGFTQEVEAMQDAIQQQYAQIQQLTREKADLEALSEQGNQKSSDQSD